MSKPQTAFCQFLLPYLVLLVLLATHCGQGATAPTGQLLWSFPTGGAIFGAPAIGPMGEIVTGSRDGKVYSLHPDGGLRWVFAGSTDWIEASPTIDADGNVYVGSWDGKLYALDGNSGALRWSYQTGNFISGAVAIAMNNRIICASGDGMVYALHSQTGELLWSWGPDSLFAPFSAGPVLAASGDIIYAGNEAGELYALTVSDGSLLWAFSITATHPPDATTDPAIMASAAVAADGSVLVTSKNGRIYKVSGGALQWSFAASEPIEASPALTEDGKVVFPSHDGYLYFLDAGSGLQTDEIYIGDVFYCSPALDAAGNITVAAYTGSAANGISTTIYSISPVGRVAWQYSIAAYNDSSPNIAPDGSLLIGAYDGVLYKFANGSGLAGSPWPRLMGNRRHSGRASDALQRELIDYFPSIQRVQDGWADVPWFGLGWLQPRQLPWVWHIDHGFILLAPPVKNGAWFYDNGLSGWLFAPDNARHFYYRMNPAGWLYHWPATQSTAGRWFFDYNTASWFVDKP